MTSDLSDIFKLNLSSSKYLGYFFLFMADLMRHHSEKLQ